MLSFVKSHLMVNFCLEGLTINQTGQVNKSFPEHEYVFEG